jgi:hypothetical protein
MSRRPQRFKQAEVERAVRGAQKLGPVAAVNIGPDGSISIRFGQPLAAVEKTSDDDLDGVIARIKADGKGRRAH